MRCQVSWLEFAAVHTISARSQALTTVSGPLVLAQVALLLRELQAPDRLGGRSSYLCVALMHTTGIDTQCSVCSKDFGTTWCSFGILIKSFCSWTHFCHWACGKPQRTMIHDDTRHTMIQALCEAQHCSGWARHYDSPAIHCLANWVSFAALKTSRSFMQCFSVLCVHLSLFGNVLFRSTSFHCGSYGQASVLCVADVVSRVTSPMHGCSGASTV